MEYARSGKNKLFFPVLFIGIVLYSGCDNFPPCPWEKFYSYRRYCDWRHILLVYPYHRCFWTLQFYKIWSFFFWRRSPRKDFNSGNSFLCRNKSYWLFKDKKSYFTCHYCKVGQVPGDKHFVTSSGSRHKKSRNFWFRLGGDAGNYSKNPAYSLMLSLVTRT